MAQPYYFTLDKIRLMRPSSDWQKKWVAGREKSANARRAAEADARRKIALKFPEGTEVGRILAEIRTDESSLFPEEEEDNFLFIYELIKWLVRNSWNDASLISQLLSSEHDTIKAIALDAARSQVLRVNHVERRVVEAIEHDDPTVAYYACVAAGLLEFS